MTPFLTALPAGVARAADATECYLVATGTSHIWSFDKTNGTATSVTNTVNGVTGLAFSPSGSLFGTQASQLGTIDLATGGFTPTGSSYGTTSDSIALDDVVAIAFDPRTGDLYGVHHRAGDDDLLFRVDPATGAHVPSGIGGADYLPIRRPGDSDPSFVEDLAVRADGTIFLVDDDTDDWLASIDPSTWAVTSIATFSYDPGSGSVLLDDVRGISFDADGQLYANTSHQDSNAPRTYFTVDETTAVGTQLGSFGSGSGFRGLACASEAPSTVAGTVFEDVDASGALDGTETGGPAGITVELQDAGTVVQTTTTDSSGAYSFSLRGDGTFTVEVDASTLPAGSGASTPTSQTVTITSSGTTSTGNDLAYRYASIAGVIWNDLDADAVRDAGEPGISGVEVAAVTDPGGTIAGSAVTAADGSYLIYGLSGGDYLVDVDESTLPTGTGEATTAEPLPVTVATAGAATGADIGYDGGGTISGTVWNDLDGDKSVDAGEPPLAGAVVLLGGDASGAFTTGSDGTYSFRVAAGDYTVSLDPSTPGTETVAGPISVTVTAGEEESGHDLLSDASGDVAASAFNDRNQDGDPTGDPDLAGVTVELSQDGTFVASATTDTGGALTIPDLEAGTYDVVVTGPPDTIATTTPPTSVDVTVGGITTLAPLGFAYAAIGGTVWNDVDGEGDFDETEVLEGMTVELTDGTTTWTTTTADDGTYRFDDLPGGTYTATVDGDGRGTPTLSSVTVTVADGEHSLAHHLGVDASVTVPVTVFNDLDGDGERDAGEPGIAGATVELTDGTTTWSQATDASGDATFDDLLAGTYTRDVDEGSFAGSGASTTANDPYTYELADGETASTETAVGYDRAVQVTGTVFNDLDGNEEPDTSEPRYEGVTVTLRDDGGVVVETDLTDAAGGYHFDDLAPGAYTVEVDRGTTIPADATRTTPETEPASTGTITVDDSPVTIDFGYDASADVTVRIWNDLDGEGDRDESETLSGIDVRLLLPDGTVVAGPATTDSNGEVSFVDLAPDDYEIDIVDATVPAGATLTSPATEPIPITLEPLAEPAIHVGYDASVELSGRVWNDLDASEGDESEPGLSGVRVVLRDESGTYLDETTTDANGDYAFVDRAPATYTVEVDETTVPGGALRTTPTSNQRTVTLDPAETADTLDFGYDASASVGNLVWDDRNGDMEPQTGEPGLAGVTVRLLDASGAPTGDTTTTDADGLYRFDDLAPDVDYQVEVDTTTLPAGGYVTTTGNPVATTDPVQPVEFDDTLDVGFWRPASVTARVFEDDDGDGTQDGVEADASGVTVDLWDDPDGDGDHTDDGTLVASATTNGNGEVAITDLAPGDYVAVVVPPSRHIVTTPNPDGTHPFAVIPGENETLADTGLQPFIGDPRIDIADTTDRAEVTQTAVYPLTLTNDGNVADTYTLTTTSSEGYVVEVTTSADPTTPVSTIGPLDPGASVDLLLHVTVDDDATRGTTDTTSLTAISDVGTTDDPDQPTATETVSVDTTVIAPVLSVTKWSFEDPDPGFVTSGQRIPYTVEVTNVSGSDVATARSVQLDDTPSHGAIDTSTVAVNGVDVDPDPSFPLALGDVPAGTTVTVTFEVVLPSPLPDGTGVSNSATATPTGNPVPTGGDLSATGVSETDTVESAPLPALDLTADPAGGGAVAPGQLVTYTVEVVNRPDATETWRDVTVEFDPPPSGMSHVSGVTPVGVGDLAPGDAVTVTLQYRVDDRVAPGTVLTAVAWADGANASAPADGITHSVDVRPDVDLGPDRYTQAAPGSTVVHRHTLTNTGNVTDDYDLTATSDKGWPVTVFVDADGDGSPDAGEETTEVLALSPGGSRTVLVEVGVPADEPDGTSHATTVVAASRTHADVDDEAHGLIEVVEGQVAVALSAAPASSAVNPGQQVTYTIQVSNPGGAPTPAVTVTDEVPVPATYVEGSTRLDGAPVVDGPPEERNPLAAANGGLELGDLAAGATRTISFTVEVRPSVPDGTPLTNTATAQSADGKTDSESVTQLITASPVLDVAVTADPVEPGPVTARERITYRIEVANVGNAPATGTTLVSDLPSHTSYVANSTTRDGEPVPDSSSGLPTASSEGGLDLGRLEADGAATVVSYTVEVLDPVSDVDEVVQSVQVTTDQGVRASSDPLTHRIDVTPEVTLVPDGAADVPPPGQVAYPHAVTNAGDVTDTYDLDAVSDRGWAVSLFLDDDADGTWDSATETTPLSTAGPLAPGESVRFFAIVTVPVGTTSGTTDVTSVTATSQADPTVVATAIDVTQAVAPLLTFEKAATPSAPVVHPGGEITYQLIIQNRGLAAATDLLVTDRTPSGAVYQPGSTTVDGEPIADVTPPQGSAPDGNPLDRDNGGIPIPTLAARSQVVIAFTVAVPADAGIGSTIANEATLDLGTSGSISDTRQHTVSDGVVLHVDKASDGAELEFLTANDPLSYTVTVTNVGPVPASDLILTDEVPANTSLADGSPSLASPGFAIGDLATGESATATFTVEVDDPVADGDLVENVASVTGPDGQLATSRTLRHDIDVTPAVSLSAGGTATGTAGGDAHHPHTVTNTGDVIDRYELAASSSSGWEAVILPDGDGDGIPDPGAAPITSTPDLAPGDRLHVVVQVSIPEGAEPGSTDRLWVTARSVTSSAVRDGAVDQTRVVRPRLALDKAASPDVLTPGDLSTYTLTLRNTGEADATDVVLLDSVPGGTSYVSGSTRRDGVAVPGGEDGELPLVAGLDIGDLAAGEETVVTFQVTAGDDLDRNFIVNVAEAVAGNADGALAGTTQPFTFDHALDLAGSQHVLAEPGEQVVHPHVLTNIGDADDEVAISAASSFGFPVELFEDVDGDGVLDAGDPSLPGTVSLAVDEVLPLLAAVTYPESAPDGLVDDVTVTATSLSDSAVVASALDRATIVAPRLEVAKTAAPEDSAPVGGAVTYNVVVSNSGAATATAAILTDQVPAGTTYVPGSTTVDGLAVADPDGSPLAAGLDLGDLAPGQQRLVVFTVTIDESVTSGALITNVASVTADNAGTAFSDLVVTLVSAESRLAVDKQVTPSGLVGPGQVVQWTVTVRNVGSATAHDVVVSDPPVPGAAYVTGSTSLDGVPVDDDAALGSGLLIGSIAPGGARTLTFRWQVQSVGAAIDNVATVRYGSAGATVLSNVIGVTVDADAPVLPLTGAPVRRTLGTAAAAFAFGWALLYVARPERPPLPVLRRRRSDR